MFENCPNILKNCQDPREYESFVEEFMIDIKVTIASIEAACPIAKHKSLKDCPVVRGDDHHGPNEVTKKIPLSTIVRDLDGHTRKILTKSNKIHNDVIESISSLDQQSLTSTARKISNGVVINKSKGEAKIDSKPTEYSWKMEEERISNPQSSRQAFTNIHINNSTSYPKREVKDFSQEKRTESPIELNIKRLLDYTTSDANVTNNTLLVYESSDLENEKEMHEEVSKTCEDNDISCLVTKVLIIVAIVSLALLTLAFYWECTQGSHKNHSDSCNFI